MKTKPQLHSKVHKLVWMRYLHKTLTYGNKMLLSFSANPTSISLLAHTVQYMERNSHNRKIILGVECISCTVDKRNIWDKLHWFLNDNLLDTVGYMHPCKFEDNLS